MVRPSPAIVAVLWFALAGPAIAASSEKDALLEKAWRPPSHIQLEPFLAPVTGGGHTSAPVTVYIRAAGADDVGEICRHSPRLRDAMLKALYAEPIPFSGGKMAFDGVPERLLGALNGAMPRRMVESVHVVQGAMPMSTGSVSKLPFNSASGCRTITEMEAKKARGEK